MSWWQRPDELSELKKKHKQELEAARKELAEAKKEVAKAKKEAEKAKKEASDARRNEDYSFIHIVSAAGCASLVAFLLGWCAAWGLSSSMGLLSLLTAPSVPEPLADASSSYHGAGIVDGGSLAGNGTSRSELLPSLDMSGGAPELLAAVAGITRELLSMANVLHVIGSFVMTLMYVFLMQTEGARVMWTLIYLCLLLIMGLRLSSRDEYGSQVVGGFFLCGVSLGSPVLSLCILFALNWNSRTDLPDNAYSLADFPPWSPLPVMLLLVFGPLCASAIWLYDASGFPLLLIPANLGLYALSVLSTCMVLRYLPVLRRRKGLLQPEVLATFLYTLATLSLSSSSSEDEVSAPVRLSLLVSSMNSLLVSTPIVLLGLLELAIPRNQVARNEGPAWITHAIWDLEILEDIEKMVKELQNTAAFTVAAGLHLTVWVVVMTASLRLRLWTCRPFTLLSLLALCAVIPRNSYAWGLGVKVPLGLWLLALALYVETVGGAIADPVLMEVLRWLGPKPKPFLVVVHALLQVSTINSAMIFLMAGLDALRKQVGERSWVLVTFALFMAYLAMGARAEAQGMLQQAALSLWAAGWLALTVCLVPSPFSRASRISLFVIYTRWILLATSHDSTSLAIASAGLLVLCFISCIDVKTACGTWAELGVPEAIGQVGDSDTLVEIPKRMVVLLLMAFIGISLATSAKLPLALGCFMFYGLVAWLVSDGTLVVRFMIVGVCGIATMFLADTIEAAIVPAKAIVGSIGALFFEPATLESLSEAPPDLRLPVFLLRDLVAVISGQAGLEGGDSDLGSFAPPTSTEL